MDVTALFFKLLPRDKTLATSKQIGKKASKERYLEYVNRSY
jgi:hypothetical protein